LDPYPQHHNTNQKKILKQEWMLSSLQVENDLGLASQDPVQGVLLGYKHLYVGKLLIQDQHS
jgi:hypothetical protein